MKIINEQKIYALLADADKPSMIEVKRILNKSRALKRLSLKETALLLSADQPEAVDLIFAAAAEVKDAIYGRRIVLFAPLYISNYCVNSCSYCAFAAGNRISRRKALSEQEITEQTEWLLKRGHKRILMVSGESAPPGLRPIEYYISSVRAIYRASALRHRVRRVNINCAPLEISEFRQLKSAGIGTYQLFQETYHDATYRQVHPKGPKSDPDNRLDAIDRAFSAGIDDVGVGLLYGLYDFRFETLALLTHIEYLEKKFRVGPHTISVPRIEPAAGSALAQHPPYKVSDQDFRKLVAVLRLSVPYTGMILSTREKSSLRDELFSLGVSQVSAESRTSPGGYSGQKQSDTTTQFDLSDRRSLDEVIASLLDKQFIPSFCAACYRKQRTGEAFMGLAKPGMIKGKCNINALITLKEYLDDFASRQVRRKGDELIASAAQGLNPQDSLLLKKFLGNVSQGVRDEFI